MSNDITDGVLCFSFFSSSFFLYLHLIWCVCACVRRAAIFNMATILKLVCGKGLRGYARFAVLFLLINITALQCCSVCSLSPPTLPTSRTDTFVH